MADLTGFDASQIDPKPNHEPLPNGDYIAVITGSEVKPTKAGTGSYLQLTFEVFEGPHKGRLAWTRLNLDNPNATAVAIAQAELSAICRAVDVLKPNDSSNLHNLPLVITVKCKKREDNGEISNEIAGYAKRPGAAPEATPAPPNTGTTPPWKRSA